MKLNPSVGLMTCVVLSGRGRPGLKCGCDVILRSYGYVLFSLTLRLMLVDSSKHCGSRSVSWLYSHTGTEGSNRL